MQCAVTIDFVAATQCAFASCEFGRWEVGGGRQDKGTRLTGDDDGKNHANHHVTKASYFAAIFTFR